MLFFREKKMMDLTTGALPFDPIIWTLLVNLVQAVISLIRNPPPNRIEICQVCLWKLLEVDQFLQRIQQSRSIVVDATLSFVAEGLKDGLSALHQELDEVLTMNRGRYFLQGRNRTENLVELVRRVDSSLSSLSAALLFSLHEQQVGERARHEEENARLTVVHERLSPQVGAGGPPRPHQDNVFVASTMEQCERVASLVPYVTVAHERLSPQVGAGGPPRPHQDNVFVASTMEQCERVASLVPYVTVAHERLSPQVGAGGPRPHQDEVLAGSTMEQSERVASLVPYITVTHERSVGHGDEVLAARKMQQSVQESSERAPSLVPYIVPHANVTLAEENAGRLGTFLMLGLEQEGREEAYYARAVAAIDEGSSGLGVPVPCLIHHRDHHMCGQCARRIVGRRFHSRHIPDYDLCEECYRGSGVNLRFFLEE